MKTIDFIFKKPLLKEVMEKGGEDFILKKLNKNYFYASIEIEEIEFLKWAENVSSDIYILERF